MAFTHIRRSGEVAANQFRDKIRSLASSFGLMEEASVLDGMVGALFGTREAELTASTTVARWPWRPCDPNRMALFQNCHRVLCDHPPISRIAPGPSSMMRPRCGKR